MTVGQSRSFFHIRDKSGFQMTRFVKGGFFDANQECTPWYTRGRADTTHVEERFNWTQIPHSLAVFRGRRHNGALLSRRTYESRSGISDRGGPQPSGWKRALDL